MQRIPQFDFSGKLVVGETTIQPGSQIPVEELSFDERPQAPTGTISIHTPFRPPITKEVYEAQQV